MKFGKSNLFSIFLIIVAFVIVVSIGGLIFRTVKQSSVYEGYISSDPQYYDPSIPTPVLSGTPPTNASDVSWAPGSNYANSNTGKSVCTYCNTDFAVVFQNTTTGYFSQTPLIIGNAGSCAGYCNPTIYVSLNAPPPSGTQLVLLVSRAATLAPNGKDTWYIVPIPAIPATNIGNFLITGPNTFQIGGLTQLITSSSVLFNPQPAPTPEIPDKSVVQPAPTSEIPDRLVVRPADPNWKSKIDNNDGVLGDPSSSGSWPPDTQFAQGGSNKIGEQFNYFAEHWLNVTGLTSGQTNVFSKNKDAFEYYGIYSFSVTTNGSIKNYTGNFNPPNVGNTTWNWSVPPAAPAAAPAPATVAAPAPAPAAAPATYYGPTSKIWKDSDCNVLKNINANLNKCKTECDNTPGCTAFNYSDKDQACILRACADGTEPTWDHQSYQGYSKYKTSDQNSKQAVTPAASCPSYDDAPTCPPETVACGNNNRYCYYQKKDMMVSTYTVPTYDYCPSNNTGNKEGKNLPFNIYDVPVWYRQGGKDAAACNAPAPAPAPATVAAAPAPAPAAAPATYYGPTSKIWKDSDCNVLKNIKANLNNCKTECDNTPGCTAFNYSDKEQACILRACADGTEPTWDHQSYQGYSKYKTSDQNSKQAVTPSQAPTHTLHTPTPIGGRCDRSCKKVTDILMANNTYGVCKFDKNNGYKCLPCPTYGKSGMDCNQFQKCSGCPPNMIKTGWPSTKKRGGDGGDSGGGIRYYDDDYDDDVGWLDRGGGGDGRNTYRKRDTMGKDKRQHRGGASYGPYGKDDGGGIYNNDGTGRHDVTRRWWRNDYNKYETNYNNANNANNRGGNGNNSSYGGNGYGNTDSDSCKQGTNFIKKFLNNLMGGGVGGGLGGIGTPVPYMDHINF